MGALKPVAGTTVYLWKYVPNLPASIVFAGLYFIMGCLISFRMQTTKTWFCSFFVFGCIMEVVGYITRALAVDRTGSIAAYLIQACCILIPPAFFAATIYMILARIIRAVDGDHLSIINPRIVTRVFVLGDMASFNVQGASSGLWSHKNLLSIATALVLIGLAIQLIFFTLFGVCAIIFHRRIRRSPTTRSREIGSKWRHTLYMLYAVSILIVIRSIYRIMEYAFGQEGYFNKHEWTMYAFDSAPMILVTVIFFVCYPSDIVVRKSGEEAIMLESHTTIEEQSSRVVLQSPVMMLLSLIKARIRAMR